MSNQARSEWHAQAPLLKASLVFWCGYMLGAGLLLALVPDLVVRALGLPAVEDHWIRAFGALAFNIGLVYIPILRSPLQKSFIHWTIYARYLFAVLAVFFVVVGWFPAVLLLVGAFDAVNATWTWVGLRQVVRRSQ